MGELRSMGPGGDTKVIWDPENEDEVAAAETQFDTLKEKGFKAFYVNKKGEAGKEMEQFDSNAEKIIMVPQIRGG